MYTEGVILQITFLQPPADHESLIILVAIVSVQDKVKCYTYQWDEARRLREIDSRPQRHPIPRQLVNPLLLIPLQISPGFALVSEHKLGVCGDIRINEFAQIEDLCDLTKPEREAADDPGNSLGAPLYTSWARPFRHAGFNARGKDTVYLCREDGLIRLAEFHRNSTMVSSSSTPLGHLRISVNTAFTVVDHDLDLYPGGVAADVLLAGGSMSDGGLFMVKARQDPSLQQVLPNWTPIQDFTAVSSQASSSAMDGAVSPDRIFACTGRGRRHGSLCEIRFGIEGQNLASFNLESSVYTHLSLLPVVPDGGVLILASSNQGTDVLYYSDGDMQSSASQPEVSWYSLIDRDSATICAGRAKNGICIQITKSAVRAMFQPDPTASQLIRLEDGHGDLGDMVVTNACIQGRSSSIVLLAQTSNKYLLLHARLIIDGDSLKLRKSTSVLLDEEPTCIELPSLDDHAVALVGTRAGELLVFEQSDTSLSSRATYKFENQDDICESILALPNTRRRHSSCAIICGLRSGSLSILDLSREPGGLHASVRESEQQADNFAAWEVTHRIMVRLGNTAVTVRPHFSNRLAPHEDMPDGAIAMCEKSLYHFFLAENGSVDHDSFRLICMTDQQGIGSPYAVAKDVAQLEPWNRQLLQSDSNDAVFTLFASEIKVLDLKITAGSKVVPCHIHVHGNPSRVVHLKYFNKLVTALTVNGVMDPASCAEQSTDNSRVSIPVLKLVDPDGSEAGNVRLKEEVFDVPVNLPPDLQSFAAVVGKSGTKVTGMSDWPVTAGGKRWHILLVSTFRPPRTESTHKGRVWIFTITSNPSGNPTLEWKRNIDEDEAIYSVAGYDSTSFVYCAGTSLYLQYVHFSGQGMKLVEKASKRLGSVGRSISVKDSVIYVSTSAHSLRAFRISGKDLKDISTDAVSRDSLHHLVLSDLPLVLASHTDGRLIGFLKPSNSATTDEFSTTFEATLPGKIVCLQEAALRPLIRSRRGQCSRPILASTLDGTFYQIDILNNEAYKLLEFIQKLAQRHKEITPQTHEEPSAHAIDSDSQGTTSARERHIDGDIVRRVLTSDLLPGERDCLRELISAPRGGLDTQLLQTLRYLTFAATDALANSDEELLDMVAEFLRTI